MYVVKAGLKALSKRETLKAVNLFLICLILFKFSTLTDFSMLFQVKVFSFVFGENLESHVAGGRGPLLQCFIHFITNTYRHC